MLDTRSNDVEIADQPDSQPEDVARSLWYCKVGNRHFGGTRVVRKLLHAALARVPADRPVRVLDVGGGLCDICVAMSRWAANQGREIQFICLERHPHAARLARQAASVVDDSLVAVVEGDILSHRPDEPYDFAIGALFFHHLTDEGILEVLEHLRTFVRHGVLISDLRRCGACYRVWSVVSRFFSPVARHDILASIRRGFRPWELRRLLRRMQDVSISVTRHWFCRLGAEVWFD